jgi:hypothetical protein
METLGQNCRSGCPTKNHATWGECARAAEIQIDKHGLQNRNLELDKDRRLTRYADARKVGLQPKSTRWQHVREAFETGGVAPTPVQAAA